MCATYMCYVHVLLTWTCTTFTNIETKKKSKCTLLTQADRQHTNTHVTLHTTNNTYKTETLTRQYTLPILH